ncbi:MAG: hypothetical protein CVU59_11930, partial [Deltaproteobacteria bacterium HGW-Deltaproteobacteria-17]
QLKSISDFNKNLQQAGFADESAFISARLPQSEREALQKMSQQLEADLATLKARDTENQSALQAINAQQVSTRPAEEHQQQLLDITQSLKETRQQIGAMQQRIVDIARVSGMRVWGPNCTGLVNTRETIFTPFMRLPNVDLEAISGNVAILAQSGMLAAGFMLQVIFSGFFKVSKSCAIGNKADIGESEVLEYLAADDATQVVLAYLESIPDGRRFLEAARSVLATKPLIVLKGGRSEAAAQAAVSHTASLAGADNVIDGALRQLGVFRAADFMQMMQLGKAFSLNPGRFEPATSGGNRVALITVSGGAGVVALDLMQDAGLKPATLSAPAIERLQGIFPSWMPPGNPIDIWPAIEKVGVEKAFSESIITALEDEDVDGVLLLPFSSRANAVFPAELIGEASQRLRKPVVSWVFGDIRFLDEYRQNLESQRVPVYDDLRTCIEAMSAYLTYARGAAR